MFVRNGNTDLFSVSSTPSKLFCFFNSAIKASFAASSESVGKLNEMGGVTPSCFVGIAAISSDLSRSRCFSLVLQICRIEDLKRYCKGSGASGYGAD